MNSSTIRTDFAGSLICHAAVIGVLFAVGSATAPQLSVKPTALADEKAIVENPAKSSKETADAADAAKPQPADATPPAPETAPTPAEPVRTAAETTKALVGAEAKQSVAATVPANAPESVKAQLAAALEAALAEALQTVSMNDGTPLSRAEIEMATAENVAGQLRTEVTAAYAESAAKEFSKRALEDAQRKLEEAAAAELGPAAREMIAGAGAEMAGAEPTQSPQRAADLAIHDKDPFQKTLESEARKALASVAPAELANSAAEIVSRKLAAQGVPAEGAGLDTLRASIASAVAAMAGGRSFNTGAVWKPSSELVLPGTKKNKPDEALAAKLAEVGEKQTALMREKLPQLAAAAARAAKWNESFGVTKETEAKIETIHRLETHMANLKAGRGGAAEASLASSLAALLGGGGSSSGGNGGDPNMRVLDGDARFGRGGRNFNEAAFRELVARIDGRPAGAGGTDLQQVAGEAREAAGGTAAAPPAQRIVAFAAPPAAEIEAAPAALPAPPFASIIFTAARHAARPPQVDGDLSEWDLAAPHAAVRTLFDNSHLATGPDVYFQWRAEGLYFAYRLADTGGIQVSSGAPYHGDCFELFLDSTNSRAKSMRESNSAAQYFFMPFGWRGDATRTFEKGGGVSLPTGRDLPALNASRKTSFCTGKQGPGGYAVEGFLSLDALRRRLAPGVWLGLDVSVSPDFEFPNQMQWAAAKSLGNWDRPNTWGDLLLLGSRARVGWRAAKGEAPVRHAAALNETLIVEVSDADMNLDTATAESVAVKITRNGADDAAQVLLLHETGPDTGIFQSRVLLASYAAADAPGTLRAQSGDRLTLTYIDAMDAAAARNQPRTAALEVGWPVLRINRQAAR